MAGEQPGVRTERLTKEYRDPEEGKVDGAREVTFSCYPGQIYGLLGPNGAGKTTTLRMLSTVLTPTAGDAWVAGHDVTEDPQKVRRNIGFLSGETGLYPRLTAREMVSYFGKLYGMDGARLTDRVDELLSMMDMTDFEHKRCENLSTGMKQKVNIARTLVHDPPVLILDEPTVGLDVMTARTIVDFIHTCRDRGKTVLLSTHDMNKAERLCDRIGLIHEARLRGEGTATEFQDRTGADNLEDAFLATVDAR